MSAEMSKEEYKVWLATRFERMQKIHQEVRNQTGEKFYGGDQAFKRDRLQFGIGIIISGLWSDMIGEGLEEKAKNIARKYLDPKQQKPAA